MIHYHYLHANNIYNVKGWVCLVTGGGTGIGLNRAWATFTNAAHDSLGPPQIAQTLAANGAKVYIASRRLDVLENAAKTHGTPEALPNSGGALIPFQLDHTDKDDVAEKVKLLQSKEPHLNLLVNNAGLTSQDAKGQSAKAEEGPEALSASYMSADPEAFRSIFNTNVWGVYLLSSALLPMLAKTSSTQKGLTGSIINITSMSGITSDSQSGQEAYNSSKAACLSLTRLMAADFKHPNIRVRVNSIAPGYFPTEMTRNSSDSANKSHWEDPNFGENMDVPAGRPGREEDMAQVLLPLACCQYLNGQSIAVEGGWLLEHGARGN